MSIKGKPVPSVPMIKNSSAAPMVYFDNAPVFGAFGGNIEIELTARALMPKPDGAVIAEMVCTGHLRCAPQAAIALHDALGKAIAMHSKQLQALAAETSDLAVDKAA